MMLTRRRATITLATLTCMTLLSLALALMVGSVNISIDEVLSALLSPKDNLSGEVILNFRLPRALAGFACGGLLALAGALLQVLLRNPLADPYVLGISGGAGVGAISAMLVGGGMVLINLSAFCGALTVMLVVFGLAHGSGSWTQTRLLLTGVIVASGCGAIIALMLSIAPDNKLHSMLFWLMGDLSQCNQATPVLLVLVVLLLVTIPFARDLNLLARDADLAQTLGVPVNRLRLGVYGVASLATASAVTQAGAIGFIGLIVPHLVRLIVGNDQRLLIPAAILAGGSLLTIADTLARYLIAPQQLPVGVLTALIGVPVFLILLSRDARVSR